MTPQQSNLPTSDDVTAAFWNTFRTGAERGVMIAQAVSEVTFTDGNVTVTFDPSLTRAIDHDVFWEIANPWENLAHYAGSTISPTTDEADWLRTVVKTVTAQDTDGTHRGTATADELRKLATG